MVSATTLGRRPIPAHPGVAQLGSDTRVRMAVAVALPVAVAVVTAWLTPRGPITTAHALLAIAFAIGLGLACGFVLRSRWSAVIAPVLFFGAFELARLPVSGPTVDAVRLDSTYGIIAFVTGRLVHLVLVIPPLVLGTLLGVHLAARGASAAARGLGGLGWTFAALLGAAVLVTTFFVATPPTTAPILGANGQPVPNSVAELTSVQIGGHEQALMIRGRNTDNPVLLYLAGGPGGTDLGAMRGDVGLEQDFVVVTWDQRGTGKSYAALDPAATFTVGQMVADTIELTNYLRTRFGEQRIYIVGNSWGTLLGVLAVQQRPELYHAFVGTGQMVSTTDTDRMFWEDTIAWAEATGDTDLVTSLRAQGPPPYTDVAHYEQALSYEHAWNPYPELDTDKEMPANLFVPENSLMDRINGLRAFLDTFSVLYPQLISIDLRTDAASLDVPVYMVLGAHEARGRAVPANDWFETLDAPTKERIVFAHSGHRPSFEEPAIFAELMRRVFSETYTGGR